MTLKEKAEEYFERWLHKSTAYYDKEQRTGIPTWLRDEASGPIIKTYLSGYKEALNTIKTFANLNHGMTDQGEWVVDYDLLIEAIEKEWKE